MLAHTRLAGRRGAVAIVNAATVSGKRLVLTDSESLNAKARVLGAGITIVAVHIVVAAKGVVGVGALAIGIAAIVGAQVEVITVAVAVTAAR